MKKITLLFYCVLFLVFSTNIVAQTLNQNANWPNGDWDLTGTYTAEGLLADPTDAASTFNWDDDGAGDLSVDLLQLESPIIDLSAAFGAGETWINVSGNYVFRTFTGDDILDLEYWDADASGWVSFNSFAANSTNFDYRNCVGTVAYNSSILDISGFSATQLSGFKYRIIYDDLGEWEYGFCLTSPTITSVTPFCVDPTAFTATSTDSDMADLVWTEGGSATAWDIELVDITGSGSATGTPTHPGVSSPYTLSGLAPGNDYEVYVRADCGGSFSNWVGPVAFTTFAACEVIPSAPTIEELDDVSIDFSWDPPATGTPTGYNWEIVENGTGQGGTVLASGFTETPNASSGNVLTENTLYNVFVQTVCGADGTSVWDGPYTFTTESAPPANDDCGTAISVTQETEIVDASGATATPGTIAGATDSGLSAEECNDFTGNANDDVWYSFVALTSNVTITYEITGFDGVVQLYSGTCGALTVVDCSDSSVTTAPIVEEISATGLTVGATYYTRIYQWNTSSTAGKTFDLKIWSPDTLSTETFENENAFSYFPNPVKNELTLKAQNNIQKIAVYNMLGQEVLKTAPDAIESNLEMNGLAQGAYIVKVTINNVTETIRVIKQ